MPSQTKQIPRPKRKKRDSSSKPSTPKLSREASGTSSKSSSSSRTTQAEPVGQAVAEAGTSTPTRSQNSSVSSPAEVFLSLSVDERKARLANFSEAEAEAILFNWDFWARPSQKLPVGEWRYWLVRAGRGFGKTRIGAEVVRMWQRDFPLVNLIGATADDARDIMIEGESGILNICPKHERPLYVASKRQLHWPNGSRSLIFTADEPERLRGKQHYKLWCDELAAWRYPESWDQAMFGLRLGANPQAVVTTTPKPLKIIKELMSDPSTVETRGTTYENRTNLAPAFLAQIICTKYEGTRLGRQELNAELLEDNPGALWTHARIDELRVQKFPEMERIVVGVDPAVTSNEDSDLTGIVVAGRSSESPPHFYVLDDLSQIASPNTWAEVVVGAYRKQKAGISVVAETNNGGDLVEGAILRTKGFTLRLQVGPCQPWQDCRWRFSSQSLALYEQGRVHHVGTFGHLEDEMCDYNPAAAFDKSPDRMDALVWTLWELSEGGQHGLIQMWREDSAKLKGAPAASLTRDPGTPEQQFQIQADAQMKQARDTDVKIAGVFGGQHMQKVTQSPMSKPLVVAQTPKCPNCGNVNISRARVGGISGDIEERCNACGWQNVARGK